MPRASLSLACLFAMMFVGIAVIAQMPIPKPAPELAKLDYLAGNWTSDADLNPDKKVYTYNEYNSMGQANHSEGTINGDTWTWNSDENMGGQTFKGRFTMKVQTPTSYTYKYEMSQDGTNWMTGMEGKATKK